MEKKDGTKLSTLANQLNTELRKYPRIESIYYGRVTTKKLINDAVDAVDRYKNQWDSASTIPQGSPSPEQMATVLYNYLIMIMEQI